MYEFLDRLVNIAIPRIRDFRGISARSFDGRGNYSLGVKEQIIFPEIQYDQIDQIRGMDITISTSAGTTSTDVRCSKPSTFRFASRVIPMAKTNMLMREKHRRKIAKKYAARRAELSELIRDPKTGAGRARRGASGPAAPAARCEPDPPAQPLCDHRPPARGVPQVRPRAHEAARSGEPRRDSRPDEGELVRRAL